MKVFQLKAARAVLNLSVRDIGSYIGVSGTAVSMWESKDIDLDINNRIYFAENLRKLYKM